MLLSPSATTRVPTTSGPSWIATAPLPTGLPAAKVHGVRTVDPERYQNWTRVGTRDELGTEQLDLGTRAAWYLGGSFETALATASALGHGQVLGVVQSGAGWLLLDAATDSMVDGDYGRSTRPYAFNDAAAAHPSVARSDVRSRIVALVDSTRWIDLRTAH